MFKVIFKTNDRYFVRFYRKLMSRQGGGRGGEGGGGRKEGRNICFLYRKDVHINLALKKKISLDHQAQV